jgi:hypothetical protein
LSQKFTIEDLSAYLDGELDEDRSNALEQALETDAALREELERLSATDAELRSLSDAILKDQIPERLLKTLETPSATTPGSRQFDWLKGLLAPAPLGFAMLALVAGLMLSPTIAPTAQAPSLIVENTDGRLTASPALASFLSEAASGTKTSVDGNAAVILLSLSTASDQKCRHYQIGLTTGLACKSGETWEIETLQSVSTPPSGDYQLASGPDMVAIQSAISQLPGVTPLDTAQEQAAIAADWQ